MTKFWNDTKHHWDERASGILAFQLTVISLLLAVLTIKLYVDHPEWSPNRLLELRSTLPHQINEPINLQATP